MNHWKSRGPILSSRAAPPPCQQASLSLSSQLHLRTPSLGPSRSAGGCQSQSNSPVLTTTPTPPSPTALQPTGDAPWPDSCSDAQARTLCPHSSPDSRGWPLNTTEGKEQEHIPFLDHSKHSYAPALWTPSRTGAVSWPACHAEKSLVCHL